jgi:hypothetical protein
VVWGGSFLHQLGYEDSARVHLAALNFAAFEPAKSGAIRHADFAGIGAQFHAAEVSTHRMLQKAKVC